MKSLTNWGDTLSEACTRDEGKVFHTDAFPANFPNIGLHAKHNMKNNEKTTE